MVIAANNLSTTWSPTGVGAFEDLYAGYQPDVERFLLGMCGDVGLAEELTQEVFVRAASNLLLFRGESSVRTWLFRIARNTYLSWAERQRDAAINTSQFLALPDRHAANDPEAQMIVKEQRATIRRAMGMLPERQRTILLLRDLQELSYADIAIILEMSLSAVKVNLHRARLRFREVFAMIEGCEDE